MRSGGGRKWEYLRVNENGKVERPNLHVKKGDFVLVRGARGQGMKIGMVSHAACRLGPGG